MEWSLGAGECLRKGEGARSVRKGHGCVFVVVNCSLARTIVDRMYCSTVSRVVRRNFPWLCTAVVSPVGSGFSVTASVIASR
jgi:hypothetical protein